MSRSFSDHPNIEIKNLKALIFLLFFCISGHQVHAGQKITIGETAWIGVEGLPFSYLARVDTGAKSSSINATNIIILDKSTVYSENIGKTLSFETRNRDGRSQSMTAVIVKVSNIRNSQGIEQRYVIRLPLSWKHVRKIVEVNLRNRSTMNYKLLIGRNFLSEDFLVDVEMKADNDQSKGSK